MIPSGIRPTVSNVRASAGWPNSAPETRPNTPVIPGAAASAPRPTGRHPFVHAPSSPPAPSPAGTSSPTTGTPCVIRWRLPSATTAATTSATRVVPGDQAAGSTSIFPRTGTAVARRLAVLAREPVPPAPARRSLRRGPTTPCTWWPRTSRSPTVRNLRTSRRAATSDGRWKRFQGHAASTARARAGRPVTMAPTASTTASASAWGTTVTRDDNR